MYEPGHTQDGADAVLDPSRLVAVFGEDRQAIAEILVMAVDSVRGLIDALQSSLERADLEAAKAGAHEIKGVAGNIGAGGLEAAARALEGGLSKDAGRPGTDLVAPLQDAYSRFAARAQDLIDRSR